MPRFRLMAGLLSAAVIYVGPVDLPLEREIAMIRKASADTDKVGRSVPKARDPAMAVAEEYEAARKKGTVEALMLFIERHPEGPLAEKARADLRRLMQR